MCTKAGKHIFDFSRGRRDGNETVNSLSWGIVHREGGMSHVSFYLGSAHGNTPNISSPAKRDFG